MSFTMDLMASPSINFDPEMKTFNSFAAIWNMEILAGDSQIEPLPKLVHKFTTSHIP